jgi:hypothetical protein
MNLATWVCSRRAIGGQALTPHQKVTLGEVSVPGSGIRDPLEAGNWQLATDN